MYKDEKQTILREHLIRCRDGHSLALDIYKPHDIKEDSAVLLFVHGGGFVGGDKDQFLAMAPFIALQKGVVCITLAYRTDAPYPAAVFDVIETVNWIAGHEKALSVDKRHLVVIGGSPGANISLLAASKEWRKAHKVNEARFLPCNLVLLNAIFSLRSLWALNEELHDDILTYLSDESKLDEASPSSYKLEGCNILMLHGEKDSVVPYKEAIAAYKKWEGEGNAVTLREFKNEGHAWFNSLYKHVPVINEITGFIDKLEEDKCYGIENT